MSDNWPIRGPKSDLLFSHNDSLAVSCVWDALGQHNSNYSPLTSPAMNPSIPQAQIFITAVNFELLNNIKIASRPNLNKILLIIGNWLAMILNSPILMSETNCYLDICDILNLNKLNVSCFITVVTPKI